MQWWRMRMRVRRLLLWWRAWIGLLDRQAVEERAHELLKIELMHLENRIARLEAPRQKDAA